MYHLWFLEYQRVLPQPRLPLPRHHLHHRSQHPLTEIQYQITEVWKLQYQKEVEVRMKSFGETRCRGVQTLPVRLMNLQWIREHTWNQGAGKHNVFTHFPKDPNCEKSLKTKITRASCRKRAHAIMPRAENFGDLNTADHKVPNEESESRNNHRYVVVVQDLATQWLQSYPCKTKTSQETQKNLMKFLEPARKPEVMYTDNSLDFGKSCEELSWNHCTSTTHRSEQMGWQKEQCVE